MKWAKKLFKKEHKRGYTLVEISLFLGITMFIVVAFMATTGPTINRQRYNDTINDFAEFLRGVYSETVNVQNERMFYLGQNDYCSIADAADIGGRIRTDVNDPLKDLGRSRCAIYGKLITFGENMTSEYTVHTYDVVGRAVEHTSELNDMSTLEALAYVKADVVSVRKLEGKDTCKYATTGTGEFHNLQWLAQVEDVDKDLLFKGAILIIRSPASGTVHTYVTGNKTSTFSPISMNIQQLLLIDTSLVSCTNMSGAQNQAKNMNASLMKFLSENRFKAEDLSLCIDSADASAVGNRRREVRIKKDGHGQNAVELIDLDVEGEARCKN
ncbi:hypothetical protein IJK16_02470 [Candidatus Saccharibacteria bacterium]|jgi:hypothetical protein|nr:hypothetical protein [Candidatus Saccharibacteria bacterium]